MKSASLFVALALLAGGCATFTAKNPYDLPDGLYSEITTPRGVVVCELYYRQTPMTVASYVGLAEGTLGPRKGQPFFNGLKWHRVVKDFVVQGGDGGRIGYSFPDECVPGLRHDSAGVVEMANDGPDSNGSQYCLMLSPQMRLNYQHTVFGHVVRGMEVLPLIQQGDTMQVKILRLGPDARAFKADQAAFDALVARATHYSGPRRPGPDAPFDDPDHILPTNIPRAADFNFKLANFERFTGRKLAARLLATAPEGGIDDYLTAMSRKLGTARQGAFAVYIADTDEWHIRIGEESRAAFLGRTPPADLTQRELAMRRATQQFLSQARHDTDGFIAWANAHPNPANPLTPAQKIKLNVDAVLDGLTLKLEPETATK
jgi:cyclophilin family peptidyl-prolyl cis-trans isomerase